MSVSRNIYQEDVDFAQLALQDPDFAKILKPNGQLDFSDPKSVQQLTISLLKRDFALKLELPDDRLCPPVPNRLNYILWIQALLDTSSRTFLETYEPERRIHGLDIGTGASCIYPLLGCAQRSTWRFTATDIDNKSLEFARRNVQMNGLDDRIHVLQTHASSTMVPLDAMKMASIDFTMCNPPFYTSKEDLVSSASSKKRPPFTACTGSETEMVCDGGEVAFVSRMIQDSLVLRERVQWYTSMLGKFSSIAQIIEQLKHEGIDNYAVTEFVQGNRTRRWAVGWSFMDLRPSMVASRGCSSLQKSLLPVPVEQTIDMRGIDKVIIASRINHVLEELPIHWTWKANVSTGIGFCDKAVWSRAARRHRPDTSDEAMMEDIVMDNMKFGFKVCLLYPIEEIASMKVVIRWLKGHDSILFESFCGMLRRKIQT